MVMVLNGANKPLQVLDGLFGLFEEGGRLSGCFQTFPSYGYFCCISLNMFSCLLSKRKVE